MRTYVLAPAIALALSAALAPAIVHAQADAGAATCVVRVVSPADGLTNVRSDLTLEFEVSKACPDPLPTPAPTLRDPNGALVSLELARDGTKLTARPLGFLIDGLFEVDPGSRTDECVSKPARATTFRVGAGPDVRAVVFTPHDKYTTGSELDSVEIFLSEPLRSGSEADIPKYVSVSGLDPSDIYYLPDTASILWSWKTAASGIPPTTTERVTVRVLRGLTFDSGKAMATDFEISVRPKDFLVHGWWPGAKACAEPTNPDPDPGTTDPGKGIACGSAGSPLGLAAAFLLAPLLARLALRRRARS
ncbi:MAG TPA: hypothetical protein VGK67_34090 [Myxococcales bacterium]